MLDLIDADRTREGQIYLPAFKNLGIHVVIEGEELIWIPVWAKFVLHNTYRSRSWMEDVYNRVDKGGHINTLNYLTFCYQDGF